MSGWLTEGVAKRVMYGHPNPIIHLVTEMGELWCSGGPGREFAAGLHRGTGGGRPCPKCTALLRDAIAEEMADTDEFPRFTR